MLLNAMPSTIPGSFRGHKLRVSRGSVGADKIQLVILMRIVESRQKLHQPASRPLDANIASLSMPKCNMDCESRLHRLHDHG